MAEEGVGAQAAAGRMLIVAAAGGDVAAMQRVLDHPSADQADMLVARDRPGGTALMRAAEGGFADAMLLLDSRRRVLVAEPWTLQCGAAGD
ncbi:hypothetical protein FOA52_002097 [Chlamydomonas sp. UWO 241]|nr:hypothetical protein FOA52_002097 [Chlamydomonas sp. UWO 241]